METEPTTTDTSDEQAETDDVTAHVFVDAKDTTGQSDPIRNINPEAPEL